MLYLISPLLQCIYELILSSATAYTKRSIYGSIFSVVPIYISLMIALLLVIVTSDV